MSIRTDLRQLSFQRVAGAAPMSEQTRAIVRDNILRFYVKGQQAQDGPEGLTALYERLSQEDKNDGESNSIANQKKILERYCKEKGYVPFRHYDEDDGYSGTNFSRPGFQRMLADIKAGKIARVVVKDMSRFGRDYLQVGMYTDVLFAELGVHFVAINDGVDSTRGDNEFTAIRNVFNEMYARDTSKKIRATWQSKGRSGEHLSVNPPYGYEKDPDSKKRWVIDEEAAAIVQTIYALCAGGMGPTQIAKWLRRNQILTPTAHGRAKGRKPLRKPPEDPCKWNAEAVSSILERVEYLGHTVNFKTARQSYKSSKKLYNDPEKWAVFENTQEPIIEESVFQIVQNLRQSRKRPTRQGDMGMFSGLLHCGDCGGKMYLCRASRFKPDQEYFICSTYRKDRENCTTHIIRNVVLAEIVLRNLQKAIAYVLENEGEFTREADDSAMLEQGRELARKREALAKAEQRAIELDKIIKRLYEDNVSGKLTDERFIKLSREYEREQSELKAPIEAARKELKDKDQSRANVKSFIAAAKKHSELTELDASVLREFIDRIYISAADRKNTVRDIRIVYNFIGAFDFAAAAEQAQTPSLKAAGKG